MAIKKIRVSNFKSFDDLEIEPGQLNILIGANASGKSNFLQIFKFLKDITHHGLKNAISLQGGVKYFRNAIIGSSKKFSLEITYKSPPHVMDWEIPDRVKEETLTKSIARYFDEATYKFTLEFTAPGNNFKVIEDELSRTLKFCEVEKLPKRIDSEALQAFDSGIMTFSNMGGQLAYEFKPETALPEKIIASLKDISPILAGFEKMSPQALFMETAFFDILNPFGKTFHNVPIYNFAPDLSRKAIPLAGITELEEDGNNLAIVLKNIFEDEEKKRKFDNLVKYLLPFVEDLRVEQFADKFLIPALQEKHIPNLYLPASFISDGTINLLTTIIALYFEEKPLVIIEEPEKNIHPFLISRLVGMFEEASAQKQIIMTTHHPEIVKHARLENILLVSRDKAGFSTISRPGEREAVKIFLKNEIGLTDLYVQDLLGV